MSQTMTKVTLKGNPVTLIGQEPQVGSSAPNAVLTANDLSTVELSSYKGKKVILSVVPSLDTPVCDLQAKRFNQEATKLGSDIAVVVVSVDLPFAQKRWCGATGSDKIRTLSDYKNNNFGKAYGVLIDGVQILARSVFVVDAGGVLRYKQIVPEVTTEPNYEEALKALQSL